MKFQSLKSYFQLLGAYLLFFTLLRLAFVLVFKDAAYPALELLKAFLVGFRLDLSLSALFAGAPFVPLYALAQWKLSEKFSLLISKIYYGALNVVLLLLAVSEFPFYREYSSRLNHLFFEYFANPLELFVTLSGIKWVVPLAAVFIVLAALGAYWGARGAAALLGRRNSGGPVSVAWQLLLVAALTVVFTRGGLQRRPINWGAAFFSGEHFLNQTALNGSFNLFHHYQIYLEEKGKKTAAEEYFAPAEALRIAREAYGPAVEKPQSLFRMAKGPARPNIVLVFMESFSPEHVGALGAPESLSPEFDKLSSGGVLFTNFYSNGTRTSRAMVAALSSFPPLPGVNLTKKIEAQQKMPTAAHYLAELGYDCVFMYGGDRDFEDMGGFVRQNGFARVYDKSDFKPWSRHKNPIGVFDAELFEGADSVLAGLPQPFFAAVMTLTNHGPYLLPPDYKDAAGLEQEKRTFKYSDYALGRFFELARKRDYFRNTIFLVMADHPVHYGAFGPAKFRSPLLVYSPLIKNPHKEPKLSSQMDLPPTLLRLAGSTARQEELPFWGQPLAERNAAMPVFCLEDPYFGVITDKFFYRETLSGGEGRLFDLKDNPAQDDAEDARLRAQARSALQLSRELFFGGRAGRPWKAPAARLH